MSGKEKRLPGALVGEAGVHHVVSQLSLRGLIAIATNRNTPGVDILVSNLEGTWHASIQAKTSQDRVTFWPIGPKYRKLAGPGNYYVFLRYVRKESQFEIFLETADQVTLDAEAAIEENRQRGNNDWTPCWPLPKDEESLHRVRQQWAEFGVVWFGAESPVA